MLEFTQLQTKEPRKWTNGDNKSFLRELTSEENINNRFKLFGSQQLPLSLDVLCLIFRRKLV